MKIQLALWFLHLHKAWSLLILIGRDSGDGVANVYGQDGLGIESRWGRVFPHSSRSAQVPGFLTRVKRPGHVRVDHPPPYSAEVKERVELYLSYPSGPSRSVLGQTFTLLLAPWNSPFLPTSYKVSLPVSKELISLLNLTYQLMHFYIQ